MPLLQIIINIPFLVAGFFIKYLFFMKKGMGKTYLKGIGTGLKLTFSKEGRRNKIPFFWENITNYIRIQFELWINIFRRFLS